MNMNTWTRQISHPLAHLEQNAMTASVLCTSWSVLEFWTSSPFKRHLMPSLWGSVNHKYKKQHLQYVHTCVPSTVQPTQHNCYRPLQQETLTHTCARVTYGTFHKKLNDVGWSSGSQHPVGQRSVSGQSAVGQPMTARCIVQFFMKSTVTGLPCLPKIAF